MRAIKWLPIILLAMFLTGCWTLSLHPLYFPQDVVFEPSLIGSWGDPSDESGDIWTFEKSDANTYRLMMQEYEKDTTQTSTSSFEVHLVQLGDYLFLDFFPEELESGNDFYKAHMIPAHSFSRVSIKEDSLFISLLNTEWLEKSIEKKEVNIRHERLKDFTVLTASTEELQKLVLNNIEDIFDEETGVLVRMQ